MAFGCFISHMWDLWVMIMACVRREHRMRLGQKAIFHIEGGTHFQCGGVTAINVGMEFGSGDVYSLVQHYIQLGLVQKQEAYFNLQSSGYSKWSPDIFSLTCLFWLLCDDVSISIQGIIPLSLGFDLLCKLSRVFMSEDMSRDKTEVYELLL
ncbi:hypothetical protein IFM89_003214 [Coptis chinensis]|uniref:Uncharacterized protein n=1 Tax=Coptis chinensis TaxID=261450 RepID=A0A835LDA4_9MAGN|nr:hypothetical protein IFM89_003214 [Coptis chinensis]